MKAVNPDYWFEAEKLWSIFSENTLPFSTTISLELKRKREREIPNDLEVGEKDSEIERDSERKRSRERNC